MRGDSMIDQQDAATLNPPRFRNFADAFVYCRTRMDESNSAVSDAAWSLWQQQQREDLRWTR